MPADMAVSLEVPAVKVAKPFFVPESSMFAISFDDFTSGDNL
jgi:hypothetical protein